MIIDLPTEPIEAQDYNPRLMILAGLPKQGKSSIMANVKNNLIIDLEGGYKSLKCMRVNATTYQDLRNIVESVKAMNEKNGGKPFYKYITLDNSTSLEKLCIPLATVLYQNTPSGKNWGWVKNPDNTYKMIDGKRVFDINADVRKIGQGYGWPYYREAITNTIKMFYGLAETLILVTHLKDKVIDKDGDQFNVNEIDLAGKMSYMLAGEADAVGLIYRKKNKTILSFKNNSEGSYWEARLDRLRGKEFVVIESDDDNNLTYHLDEVF